MAPSRWEVSWVRFNILMFSAYALFGALSVFWPTVLERLWLYPLHFAGLIFVYAIIYGLVRRRLWTPVVIVLYSAGMIAHLLVFTFVPISMALAYVGPSRSFYSLAITGLSLAGAEERAILAITGFNAAMALVHSFNIWFFLREKTAPMFGKRYAPRKDIPSPLDI